MLKKFLDVNDPEKLNYSFSLKTGCVFFALFGALLWCSDALLERRYKTIVLVSAARYRQLYLLVFGLYTTCTLAFIVHHLV